ncbi:MAG: flagellar hook-associated protein FlgL [Proteobacteria bacterium]|nr:flagellar hook-associated protein FlgL [Burkholderiales bacterium]
MSIRISTNTLFEQGVSAITDRQRVLLDVQQQISTGRRVVKPSDDPIAAGRILDLSQAQSINQQYVENADSAQSSLAITEQSLQSVIGTLQDVRTTIVNAGNPTLGDSGRAILARELRGRFQELLGLANATDGQGQFLFSGYRGATQPFSETSPGNVQYAGDQGQRMLQISASRFVPVSEAGSEVFQRIRTGNGDFAASAATANTGTGKIGIGALTDPTAWNAAANPANFTLRFDVNSATTPPTTTYDIVNNVSGNSLLTGAPASATGPYLRTFTPGSSIDLRSQGAEPPFNFGGNVSIDGDPADADTFTVVQSPNQSVFATIDNLITALSTTVGTPAQSARLTNDLTAAIANIDQALRRALDVQTASGARQAEVESTQATHRDIAIQYDETVGELRDVDYAKAISDLTLQQTLLEAAQQSFLRVQNLSLFEIL